MEEGGAKRVIGGSDREGRLWVLSMFTIGGVALGALLPWLARWAAGLPWVPFQGPLELFGSFDHPWLVWARPALGLVAGAGFGAFIVANSPVLEIDRDAISVRRRGEIERVIDRSKVDGVYRRGSKVVIESSRGRTLFDDDIEGDRVLVRAAFVDLGYPWEGGTGD